MHELISRRELSWASRDNFDRWAQSRPTVPLITDDFVTCLRQGNWRRALYRFGITFANVMIYVAMFLVIVFGVSYAIPPGLPFSSIIVNHRDLPTYDFASFMASGQAAARGQNPFLVYPLTFMLQVDAHTWEAAPNLNPPLSVLAFQPVADFPLYTAFRAWHLLSFLLFLTSVTLLVRAFPGFVNFRRLLWVFALAGLWGTLQLGQIYIAILLALTAAFLFLHNRNQIVAGILIGLVVAIKPNFLVWPGLLLLGGYVTPAMVAGTTTLVLSAIPAVIYGPQVYLQWYQASAHVYWVQAESNASLISFAARLGVGPVGAMLSALLLVALAALVWRLRPGAEDLSGIAIVASLLTSPITWVGYTVLLLPVFFGRPWSLSWRIVAGLLIVPFPVVLIALGPLLGHEVGFGSYWMVCLVATLGLLVSDVCSRYPAIAPRPLQSGLAKQTKAVLRSPD
jgi:hypothetical protein